MDVLTVPQRTTLDGAGGLGVARLAVCTVDGELALYPAVPFSLLPSARRQRKRSTDIPVLVNNFVERSEGGSG